MNESTLEKLCNIAAAVGIASLGAFGVNVATGLLEAVCGGVGLVAGVRREKQANFKHLLNQAKNDVSANYRQWIELEYRDQPWYAQANLNNAVAEFESVIDRCVPTPEDIVGVNLSSEKLADLLLKRAADHNAAYSDDGGNQMVRAVFLTIVAQTYALIRDNPVYAATLRTYIDEELLTGIDKLRAGQEQMMQQMRELASAVSAEKGVPLVVLQEILGKIGFSDTPLDGAAIEERLREVADRHIELAARLRALSNDDPQVVTLRKQAAECLDAGDYERADQLLCEAEALDEQAIDEQQDALDWRKLSAAQTLSERGELERTRLNYLKAAEHFGAAAARALATDEKVCWQHLVAQASSLVSLGQEFGLNNSLERAIVIYRNALTLRARNHYPLDWAAALNALGNALAILGQRERGTTRLEEAVAAYRSVLEECTRARAPRIWAATQNNLGNVLYALGAREGGTARLEEAVTAHRTALEERTRAHVPLLWAMTQNNLGNALKTLGERENGTARLEEAVVAYRAALEERTRERVPLAWAGTQSNLGSALKTLGERESGTVRLEEAVAAFRAALQERTRERVPLDWAGTQNNLGDALRTLGQRETGTARLAEAIVAFRAALEERPRARVPLDWAMTQNNLGNALSLLGERTSRTAHLMEAVAAYRAALEERTRERVPLDWAMTQNNLGNALATMGERERGTAHLEEAVAAYRAALQERARDRVPLAWAETQNNLGNALRALGQRESSATRLEEAIVAFRAALEVHTLQRLPLAWAMTQINLGIALSVLGERESGTARLEQAVAAYRGAIEVCNAAEAGYYATVAKRNLQQTEAVLRQRRGQ